MRRLGNRLLAAAGNSANNPLAPAGAAGSSNVALKRMVAGLPLPRTAAGDRWPYRLHRRRRCGRPMDGRCTGPGALARFALAHRRPGGGAGENRLQRQLDQDHRPRAQWHRRRPRTGTSRRQRRAAVRGLALGRQRKHASDGFDRHCRRAHIDRPGGCVLRSRCVDHPLAAGSPQPRRQDARAATGQAYRCDLGAAGVQGQLGAAAAGRHRQPRRPAHHAAYQVVDHRWLAGVGGLHQLRHPLVPAQRRGQCECLQPCAGRTDDRGLRARPAAGRALHAGALARTAAAAESGREAGASVSVAG